MMKKYVKKLYNMIPRYGWMMLILFLAANILTYYGSRLITVHLEPIDLSTPWDEYIPFVPEWIFIYVLAYLQWAIGLICAARERKPVCMRILGGEIIAKLISLVIFVALPAAMARPEVAGDGLGAALTRLIYAIDTPDHLLPSLHCLESYICFRGALLSEKLPKWYAWVTGIFSLFVFASTVLVKQHLLPDIFAGIIVGEIGLQISRLILNKRNKNEKKVK